MTHNAFFDLKMNPEQTKMIIKVLQEPGFLDGSAQALDLFYTEHRAMLTSIKKEKSVLLFIDLMVLSLSAATLSCVPGMIQHFSCLKAISDKNLKACSVLVGSVKAAEYVQNLVDRFPGEVPTFVGSNSDECKRFLSKFGAKKTS